MDGFHRSDAVQVVGIDFALCPGGSGPGESSQIIVCGIGEVVTVHKAQSLCIVQVELSACCGKVLVVGEQDTVGVLPEELDQAG
ncbi:hypothetical protein SDC9_151800 [bioreactor metagenome]|uniref:Uncharacterized protein n=1 Tax=bioreactor metagenome TaxID=1076179 RepID=A0A645ETP1_9ZZZZ